MYLIETDILYAIMKKRDSLKEDAKRILKRSKKLHCSSATIIEIFSVLKAINKFASIAPKVKALADFPNLGFLPITPEIGSKASELHSAGLLSFFESFCAATAIVMNMTLVSSDDAYAHVPNLSFTPIAEYLAIILESESESKRRSG